MTTHATTPTEHDPERIDRLREQLLTVVREHAYLRLPEPIQLSSGEMSRDFVDAKLGLSQGRDLRLACELLQLVAARRGIDFDAVGGLTLGADQFAHGLAIVADTRWFVVRKQAKGRGTDRLVEGCRLDHDTRVLLVDDVVTTGGSIQKAYAEVLQTGAQVVLAATLVDRGDVAREFFAREGVPYEPLLTYEDLGVVNRGDRRHGVPVSSREPAWTGRRARCRGPRT